MTPLSAAASRPAALRARLADNVVHFGRVLRAAGLPVGSNRIIGAIQALELVGVARRDDVRAALAATLIDRHDQQPLFDAAFDAFWRDPKLLEKMMYLALPTVQGRGVREPADRLRRLDEALRQVDPGRRPPPPEPDPDAEEQQFEVALTFSDREKLQRADFSQMTVDEFREAQRLAHRIPLPLRPILSRRHRPAARGRIDLRRTLQSQVRVPDALEPVRSAAERHPPPVTILLDISGSMERYTRLFLAFAHGLMLAQPRVHVLVFGTRLTNITRQLRHRDPDEALARADAAVADWRGGTRIATSLAQFNQRWARRVLTGNAATLLVTDGLDRDEHGELGREAARLRRFSHELLWLNPLLRFDGFEPRAAGVRAILPHVDRMLPMHNLHSLAQLGRILNQGRNSR
jgi:uncharacterized protein with von Willebrand factor type A (vWA) domain